MPNQTRPGTGERADEAYKRARESQNAIDRLIKSLEKKRKRSACRLVSSGDRANFLAGKAAPWIVGERVQDIAAVWGTPATLEGVSLTFEQVAELHLAAFQDLCIKLEAGRHTTDPNHGLGLEIYNAARAEFRDQLRSGRIRFAAPPRGGDGGDGPMGPPLPKFRQPGDEGSGIKPQQASLA